MVRINADDARSLLCELIALPSVNPMGRPYAGREPVERQVIERISDLFRPYGVEQVRMQCSPLHEQLAITVPGRRRDAITLLESHIDTVPADDWGAAAFQPRVEGPLVFGRGACDDKGPLTAMILAVCEILESGEPPPTDIVLLCAGDEEYAQTGIKSYVGSKPPLVRGVFGEPTQSIPVLQHKGTVRWDVVVQGRSVHSAQPELGVDAIRGAVMVHGWIDERQAELRKEFRSELLSGPSICVTMVRGGRTRNAVADECVLSVDFRVIPEMNHAQAREDLIAYLDRRVAAAHVPWKLVHTEPQLTTPPLATAASDSFSRTALEICRRELGRDDVQFLGAPYGTDAAWVSDVCPAIVLGPGSIEFAHAIDERIDIHDVVRCARIYHDLVVSELSHD